MLFQGVMLHGDGKQRLRALFAIADTSRDDVMTPEELRSSLVFATKITLRNDPAHQGGPVVLTDEQNKRIDDAVAAVFAAVDADKVCFLAHARFLCATISCVPIHNTPAPTQNGTIELNEFLAALDTRQDLMDMLPFAF